MTRIINKTSFWYQMTCGFGAGHQSYIFKCSSAPTDVQARTCCRANALRKCVSPHLAAGENVAVSGRTSTTGFIYPHPPSHLPGIPLCALPVQPFHQEGFSFGIDCVVEEIFFLFLTLISKVNQQSQTIPNQNIRPLRCAKGVNEPKLRIYFYFTLKQTHSLCLVEPCI